MARKIRLTESEFHTLIKRIVKETQEEMNMSGEMEENIFGDIKKGVKRFTTGYGSDEEKEQLESDFYEKLDMFEREMDDEGYENTYYGDEEGWEEEKERLIMKAEENDFLGDLEKDELFRETRIIYKKGASGLTHLKRGLTGGASGVMGCGHTFGVGRKGSSLGESRRSRRY